MQGPVDTPTIGDVIASRTTAIPYDGTVTSTPMDAGDLDLAILSSSNRGNSDQIHLFRLKDHKLAMANWREQSDCSDSETLAAMVSFFIHDDKARAVMLKTSARHAPARSLIAAATAASDLARAIKSSTKLGTKRQELTPSQITANKRALAKTLRLWPIIRIQSGLKLDASIVPLYGPGGAYELSKSDLSDLQRLMRKPDDHLPGHVAIGNRIIAAFTKAKDKAEKVATKAAKKAAKQAAKQAEKAAETVAETQSTSAAKPDVARSTEIRKTQ